MHTDEMAPLLRTARRRRMFEMPAEVELGRTAIERLIEHRDPFLFVDRITHVDLARRTIVGTRRVDAADPVFAGHFPGAPIYPGVLQIESLGQLGLCLFAVDKLGRTNIVASDAPPQVRGLRIHHATFIEPVHPGDELVMLARVVATDAYTGTAIGQLCCDDRICCIAIMEVYFVDE